LVLTPFPGRLPRKTAMPHHHLRRFNISIVLPSILAIGLYILSIFILILPLSKRNIIEGKKEMIIELTNTVCSLIEEYRQEADDHVLSSDSAMASAIERVGRIRYGDDQKDYFWIIDKQARMLLHPYRPELEGTDLSGYRDPEGKLLFAETISVVEGSGEGFIDYVWQWQDDTTRIVPKLSYVREYEPWNWIVGTGIYLDDVRAEIGYLRIRLIAVAVIISLAISVLLLIIIQQSLAIEKKKKRAEEALLRSREKYRSLLESSTEGTLMLVEDEFIFSNFRFSELSGFTPSEVGTLKFETLFDMEWTELASGFTDPEKSVSRETLLNGKDGLKLEVVLSVSMITYADLTGYIIVIKKVNSQMHYQKDRALLSGELQSLLLMMHQPLKILAREIRYVRAEASVKEAIRLMTRKKSDILFIKHGGKIVGVINQHDLIERVLATGLDPDKKVTEIMTSPVVTLPENALMYEGVITMKKRDLSHIALTGPYKKITGVVGFREIGGAQENMAGFLIREISLSEGAEQLKPIYRRLSVLVKALTESGAQPGIITRMITSFGDAIYRRLIELAMEELGPAPCKFACIVMGSHGRGELTLAPEQFYAIITVNMQESYIKEAKKYFRLLAEKITDGLETAGYFHSDRGISASNPRWNMELKDWKKQFSNLIDNADPAEIPDGAILFDFRFIFGEQILVNQLRTHVNKESKGKTAFFYQMARAISQIRIPAKTELHPLDYQKILYPVIFYVRLFAIHEMLPVNGTRERAALLIEKGVLEQPIGEELIQGFDFITLLRLRIQAAQIARNEPPGNTTETGQLSRIEQMILKTHLKNISAIQARLTGQFSQLEQNL
jgi:PAS domain S-box-containing protein